MYEIPSEKDVEKIIITEDVVLGKRQPILVRKQEALPAPEAEDNAS